MQAFRVAVLSLVLALAACATPPVSMPYAPTVAVQPAVAARGAVSVDRVDNQRVRGREDPNWVGAIRGGFGNPVKVLTSTEPVDRVVMRAFSDGLAARGLGAGTGARARYVLSVTIHELSANQLARREAMADFTAVLRDEATGREVWRDREMVHNVDGNLFTTGTGVLASSEELLQITVRTMNQAIDRLLDKPGFRSAIRT
jgi:uncharacterized lipoprotein YajG